MHVDVIGWADQCRFAKVRTTREKWIECLQIGVVRILVTARDVGSQTEPRFQRRVLKREAGIRRDGPRANVAITEAAELVHKLKIVIPTGFPSPDSGADRMPLFACCSLVET